MNLIKRLYEKFRYAFNGLIYGLKNDSSILIQFSIMFIVVIISLVLKISTYDFIIVLVVSGVMIAIEYLNTTIELLSDYSCNNEYSETIKHIKDMSAAAVLVMSFFAAIVGIIIFIKYI